MAIMTKNLGVQIDPSSKREKVRSLAKIHQPLFLKENAHIPKWNPRTVEEHKGEKVVKFLPQELYGGADIYTEFCTPAFIPVTPKRTLWKWIYNEHYKTEYELSEPHPATGQQFYYIPIGELVNVNEIHNPQPSIVLKITEVKEEKSEVETTKTEEIINKEEDNLFEPLELADSDIPYAAMTIRDYAAITWKKPCSKKGWLNELITKTF